MVEVFKTNVSDPIAAKRLMKTLLNNLPASKVNFDLHDCDCILRIESPEIIPSKIVELVKSKGFQCKVLE
jgi:hypothetical protein